MSQFSNRWIQPREMNNIAAGNQIPPSISSNMCPAYRPNPYIQNKGALRQLNKSEAGGFNLSTSSISSTAEARVDHTSSESSEIGSQRQYQRQRHTKSRKGCNNCKKRRIKCEENHPSCNQCLKRGLQCEWPEVQIRQAQTTMQTYSRELSPPMQMQTAESRFSMIDFRLFYHFIQRAYPHQPIGNDSIWTHEVPSISHNFDYLLHAMLGLAASDLTSGSSQNSELTSLAMSHRVTAIKQLNQALSSGIDSFEQGNAMLATCYALTFQSVYVDGGLAEFMIFIRGCVLIAWNIGCKGLKFLFRAFLDEEQLSMMDLHLQGIPGINPALVEDASKSLQAFYSMCEKDYEKNFHGILVKTTDAILTSSRDAYTGLREIYAAFSYHMKTPDFQHFCDTSNIVGQLLQAHFIAIQFLLWPITIHELGDREPTSPRDGTLIWLGAISQNVPKHLQSYIEWPLSVAEFMKDPSFPSELLVSTHSGNDANT